MKKKFALLFLLLCYFSSQHANDHKFSYATADPLSVLGWYTEQARKIAQSVVSTKNHFFISTSDRDLFRDAEEKNSFLLLMGLRFMATIQIIKLIGQTFEKRVIHKFAS